MKVTEPRALHPQSVEKLGRAIIFSRAFDKGGQVKEVVIDIPQLVYDLVSI